MSFLEDCRRLIGLDSSPSHGNLAAAQFVGQLCEAAGLHVEYQAESHDGIDQCNVVARPQASRPTEEVLFQAHLDTPLPGHFSHWHKTQSNPFNASIYGDVLYGLGAAHGKLDFLCKLEAVKRFSNRPCTKPFVLVGTFGAHSGMGGAIKLVRRKMVNAKWAIIGAPTAMKLAVAGQGLALVEIQVPFSEQERVYRREHDLMESSTSQSRMFTTKPSDSADAENAIVKMLSYLTQLPEGLAVMDLNGGIDHESVPLNAVLEIDSVAGFRDPILPKISRIFTRLKGLEEELRGFTEDGFEPPFPTVNLGMIRTAEDLVRIMGVCRLPPSVPDPTYERWMRQLSDAVETERATFRVKDYRRGFTTAMDSNWVQQTLTVLAERGRDATPIKVNRASEACVFSRLGMECLVWGPGLGVGRSLAANESIKLSELEVAIEVYQGLLERLCL